MDGTIYGHKLPRGTEVKKSLETTGIQERGFIILIFFFGLCISGLIEA